MKSLDMKTSELIAQISKAWAELLDKGQIFNLRQGQYLFYENQNAVGAFLLCAGAISLLKTGDPCFKKLILSTAQPVLGMDYLFTGELYEYSAVAQSDSELFYLPKSRLLKLLPNSV